MPPRKVQFVNGEIYHVLNRGVEKRTIFEGKADYFRFISCLYELNDKNLVKIGKKRTDPVGAEKANKESLVEIIAFCLMPNHYHLILRQLVDNGTSFFMKKLGNGYVGYFNKKHERVGPLFQGRFKAVHIKTDDQLINTVCYVFTNPVELLEKTWKDEGVRDAQKAIKFLESYYWSSYLDCIGKKNFPLITQRKFLYQVFGSSDDIKKFVESWILYKAELYKGLAEIKTLILE